MDSKARTSSKRFFNKVEATEIWSVNSLCCEGSNSSVLRQGGTERELFFKKKGKDKLMVFLGQVCRKS